MNISCPACHAQYPIADEKIRGKSLQMRCRDCKASWVATALRESVRPDAAGHRSSAPMSAAPARTSSRPIAIAERPESSVLFTMAALRNSSRPPPSPAKQDDSGVIDLKALSASGATAPLPATPVASVFQSDTPPGAFTVSSSSIPPLAPLSLNLTAEKKWFVGIGAAAAVLAIIGIGLAIAPSDPPKAVSARIAATVPATPGVDPVVAAVVAAASPAAPASPLASPAVAAKAPKGDSVASAPAPSHKGAGKGKPAKSGAWASGPAKGRTSSPPAVSTMKKSRGGADPCNCHGVLACAIRCSS